VHSSSPVTVFVLIALVLALALPVAHATETQLCGIRLGQHAINLLDVYGNPDGVVVGSGEGSDLAPPAAGRP